MGKRIIVTGGSGKVGRYVIEHLHKQGHNILNFDILPLSTDLAGDVHTIKVDLTDAGQVYSAMTSHFKLTEPFPNAIKLNEPPDAVIHMAAYARNMIVSDNETFRCNTVGTYNVIEAACRLGVKKIIIGSTICVYGVTFADGDVDFTSFPVDEEIDVNPMDVYSLSKLCCERTARSFARRFNIDIYALRIGPVIAPDEYKTKFESYVNDSFKWKVHGWSYTDARDLGQICDLCVGKDGLGFQVFNATNDEITNPRPTMDFLKEECPQTPFTRIMGPREAPISNQKAKKMLGFKEQHNWHQYYPTDKVEGYAS